MKRFKRKYWIFCSIAFLFLLSVSAVFYIPYVVAEVKNPVAALFNEHLSGVHRPDFDAYGLHGKKMVFTTRDSLQLAAYLIRTEQKAKGTVIALHGYRSNKNKYLPVASYFIEAGYHFAALDLRGHNESEGSFTGFSYYEKNDVSDFIDYLEKHENIRPPFILYGHSVGAATALAVAAENKDVNVLILESIFTSLEDIIPNYIRFYTGIEIDSIPEEISETVFNSADVPLKKIRPVDLADQINIPVLFIHGRRDEKVPLQEAREVYNRINGPKSFIVIDSATHNTLWQKGGQDYFKRIIGFIEKHELR
jgi:alpha-beta hydrolase superfamily lysophospholipase